LAALMSEVAGRELRKANNQQDMLNARLLAESGMNYMLPRLAQLRLPYNTDEQTLAENLYLSASELLDGTGAMGGQGILQTASGFTTPPIALPDGRTFTARMDVVSSASGLTCRLTSTGAVGPVSRSVSIELSTQSRRAGVFDYGVASRGKIYVSGSAFISGMNDPNEASVLSMREEPVAIEAGGHATIGGDLYVTGADIDYVMIKGSSVSIGGSTDIDTILADHVHLDTEEPDFPLIANEQYRALATNVVDSSTDFNVGPDFSNILIKAGTNPDFKNDTVINGIIFVEAPNVVTFHSKVTINGMIVTEDGSSSAIRSCQLDFRAQTTAPGVNALPDTQEFAAIKAHEGTIVLAPGFGVTFRGTTNSINGTVAADQLYFNGNSSIQGDLNGSILGLKDMDMILQGNTDIRLNKRDASGLPAGFHHPLGLAVNPDTYCEPR